MVDCFVFDCYVKDINSVYFIGGNDGYMMIFFKSMVVFELCDFGFVFGWYLDV